MDSGKTSSNKQSRRISLTKKLANHNNTHETEHMSFERNQQLRASITDSKMSDEQDMNLDGSIMQPKNRPLDELEKGQYPMLSDKNDSSVMRIKEYDQGKTRSSAGHNNGNVTNMELVTGATFNQPLPKKVVTSVKNSVNDQKSSSNKRQNMMVKTCNTNHSNTVGINQTTKSNDENKQNRQSSQHQKSYQHSKKETQPKKVDDK